MDLSKNLSELFYNNFKKLLDNPLLKHLISYYRLYSTITLVFIFFPSLLALLTYSFLYGFYFGGKDYTYLNTFSIIKNFIPFEKDTVRYTKLLFSILIALFVIVYKFFSNTKIEIKISGLIFFCIIHALISLFFISDFTFSSVIKFLQIWIIPYFYVCMLLISIKVIENPLKSFFSLFLSFIALLLLQTFFPEWSWNYGVKNTILILTLFLVLVILINKPKLNYVLLTIYLYPLIVFFGLVSFSLINKFLNLNFLNFKIIIPFLIVMFALDIAFVFWTKKKNFINKFENKSIFTSENFNFKDWILTPYTLENKEDKKETSSKPQSTPSDTISTDDITNKRNRNLLIYIQSFILLVIILIIYATTPRLAISTGVFIRAFSNEIPVTETIEYAINNEIRKVEGKIIYEENNKIYLSDSNYNLMIINSPYFISTSIDNNLEKSDTKNTSSLKDMLLNK